MNTAALRSGVIVPVSEAAAAVDRWRERTCNAKPSLGVPPHITLLFPFVPAAALDDAPVAALAAIIRSEPTVGLELREPARFHGALSLAPEPAEPFVRLTEAIVRRFPDHPPYEGEYDEIVPHLTVAQGDDDVLAEVERDVIGHLPIPATVREAVLIEEIEPDGGPWRIRARLPFA